MSDDDDALRRRLEALRPPKKPALSSDELDERFAALRGRKPPPVDGNLSADEIARAQQFTANDPETRHELQVDDAVLKLLAHCEETGEDPFKDGLDSVPTDIWQEGPEGLCDFHYNEQLAQGLSPDDIDRLRNLGPVDEETAQELEAEDLALKMLAEAEQMNDVEDDVCRDPHAEPTEKEIALLLQEALDCKNLAVAQRAEASSSSGKPSRDEVEALVSDAQQCCREAQLSNLQEDPLNETALISSASGPTVSTLLELGLVKEAYEEQMAHCQFLFARGKGAVDMGVLHDAVAEIERLKSML